MLPIATLVLTDSSLLTASCITCHTTLKEVFHARPPKHTGSARRLVFSQHVLDVIKDTYEMNVELKVDFETHETTHKILGVHIFGSSRRVLVICVKQNQALT